MIYTIKVNTKTNVKCFRCDSLADVAALPTTKKAGTLKGAGYGINAIVAAGSTAICLDNSSVYKLNGDTDKWEKQSEAGTRAVIIDLLGYVKKSELAAGGSTGEVTLPDWIGDEKPKYTADEVGAIPASNKDKYDKAATTANENATAIATLNGDGDGSITKTVAAAIAEIVAGAPEDFDTLKELSDWIATHGSEATKLNSKVTKNTEDIAALTTTKADKSDIPEVKDGVTPQLRKSATAIQVSTDGGANFTDLVALADLKGETGEAGPKGDKGETGQTGPAGETGATGEAGPKGDAGEKGADGAPGKDGITPQLQKSETAIQVSTDGGVNFTDLVALADIKGEAGATGEAGPKGDAGEAGPAGKDGTNGKSAYELWKEQDGNADKSEEEFFAALKGATGEAGPKGDAGEAGPKGETGDAGKDGITPQFKKTETAIQVSTDGGVNFTDLVALADIKGADGATGKAGSAGKTGAAGASVTAITLTKDASGNITGGTATLSDTSTIAITVTTAGE